MLSLTPQLHSSMTNVVTQIQTQLSLTNLVGDMLVLSPNSEAWFDQNVSETAGVYTIFRRIKGAQGAWTLVYVGREHKRVKGRLRSHLFRKRKNRHHHKEYLIHNDRVQEYGITIISIPGTGLADRLLRECVEKVLIQTHKPKDNHRK